MSVLMPLCCGCVRIVCQPWAVIQANRVQRPARTGKITDCAVLNRTVRDDPSNLKLGMGAVEESEAPSEHEIQEEAHLRSTGLP